MITRISYILLALLLMPILLYALPLNLTQTLDDVTITGITDPVIKTQVTALELNSVPGAYLDPDAVKKDIQTIYSSGYFSAVSACSIASENRHLLLISVTENPLIATLSITPSHAPMSSDISAAFSQYIGRPYNARLLKQTAVHLTETYTTQGFSFFEITHMSFNKPSQTLEIQTQNGFLKSVHFMGLKTLPPRILLREMTQTKGTPINTATLLRDRTNLIKTGYFSTVSAPFFSQGSQPEEVKVSFKVTEKKTNKLSLGLEQNPGIDQRNTHYYGFVQLYHQHILLPSDILFLKSQVSLQNQTFLINRYTLTYSQPWLFNKLPLKTSLSTYRNEMLEVINRRSELSVRNGYTLSFQRAFFDRLSLTLTGKKEHVVAKERNTSINDYTIHSLQTQLRYQSLDNPLDPSKGTIFRLGIEQGDNLGLFRIGGLSFTKYTLSWARFHSVLSKLILGYRIQSGLINIYDTTQPSFENNTFILGGAQSLRGYDEYTDPFTGKKNLLFNIELRYRFLTRLQGVSFVDYGHAFNGSLTFKDFNVGKGVGLRYLTTIGPIRLDIAFGKTDHYVHFGIGHVF